MFSLFDDIELSQTTMCGDRHYAALMLRPPARPNHKDSKQLVGKPAKLRVCRSLPAGMRAATGRVPCSPVP